MGDYLIEKIQVYNFLKKEMSDINNYNIEPNYFNNSEFYDNLNNSNWVANKLLKDKYYFIYNEDLNGLDGSYKVINIKLKYLKNKFGVNKLEDSKGNKYYIFYIIYFDKKYTQKVNNTKNIVNDKFIKVSKNLSLVYYRKLFILYSRKIYSFKVIHRFYKYILNIDNYNIRFSLNIYLNYFFKLRVAEDIKCINYVKNNVSYVIYYIIILILLEKSVVVYFKNTYHIIKLFNIIIDIIKPIKMLNIFIPYLSSKELLYLECSIPFLIGVKLKNINNVNTKNINYFIVNSLNDIVIHKLSDNNIGVLFDNYFKVNNICVSPFDIKFNIYTFIISKIGNFLNYILYYDLKDNQNFNFYDIFDIDNFKKYLDINSIKDKSVVYFVDNILRSSLFYNFIENIYLYLYKKYNDNDYNIKNKKSIKFMILGILKGYNIIISNIQKKGYLFSYNFDDIFSKSEFYKYLKNKYSNIKIHKFYNFNKKIPEFSTEISEVSYKSNFTIRNNLQFYQKLNKYYYFDLEFKIVKDININN